MSAQLPSILLPTMPIPSTPPHIMQAVFFIVLLAAASVCDIRKRIIPNSICALIALAGLISFSPARLFGILAALPLLIPALIKQDSIGGGDIKLTAACGLALGFKGGMAGLIIGLTAMLLFYAVSKIVRRPREDKDRERTRAALPMAPFLSVGFIAAYILDFLG